LDEIGLVVYEEMSFKVKVYGRTDGRTTDDGRTDAGRKAITKAKKNTWLMSEWEGLSGE
jgi:hypothetical protein